MRNAFRALRTRNYRLYFAGQLVSLVGTWMQIVAQGWLVLKLSNSGLAVGIVTALQFGPMLLGGVWGGLIADRYPKRRILLFTQSSFLVLAVSLGALVASGRVELWMVYALAFAYGVVQVFDMPTRQVFVSEMVKGGDVMSAVSLNTAVFNAARMVGPVVAGLLIAGVNIAACFFVNGVSFLAVIVALLLMREDDLHIHDERPPSGRGQIRAGLRYVRSEPDLLLPILLMAVVSTFGLNFQIVLPLLARFTFHGDATTYGWLSLAIAFGSLVGAMYAATRHRPTMKLLVIAAILFGAAELLAAFVPTLVAAYIALPFVGLSAMLFIATANSSLQLRSSPQMRGRVLALYSLVFLGSTPIGGPVMGWLSDAWSPRLALGIGGISSLLAGLVFAAVLRARRSRDELDRVRRSLEAIDTAEPVPAAETL